MRGRQDSTHVCDPERDDKFAYRQFDLEAEAPGHKQGP